jgi:hypothetical protein
VQIHLATELEEGLLLISLVLDLNDGDVGWGKDKIGELRGVWGD